jgi:hypothetical protein
VPRLPTSIYTSCLYSKPALANFVNQSPFLAEYPRLAFFFENFEKLPGMQRYLQSVWRSGRAAV